MHERKQLQKVPVQKPSKPKAGIIDSGKKTLSQEKQKQLNNMLLDAAQNGKTKRVERLLKLGASVLALNKNGKTALMLAAWNGNTEICALLLEKGAILRPYGSMRNALHYAAEGGHTQTCAFLIGMGANIMEQDKLDRTAFMRAERNGHTQTAKFLKSIELLEPMLRGKPAISLIELLSVDTAISFMASFGECLSS